MTLPAAYATLSLGDINVELGRSRTATISLDTAENGGYVAINTLSSSRPSASNPAAVSEWYSYNHNAAPSFSYDFYSQLNIGDPCGIRYAIYRRSDNNVFYYWNGSSYVLADGNWYDYSYFDGSMYVYSWYYIYGSNIDYYGEGDSFCAPF